MALTYAVIGSSEAEVKTALDQLCDLFGLESLGASQLPAQEKWLGRAAPPLPAAITSDRF